MFSDTGLEKEQTSWSDLAKASDLVIRSGLWREFNGPVFSEGLQKISDWNRTMLTSKCGDHFLLVAPEESPKVYLFATFMIKDS